MTDAKAKIMRAAFLRLQHKKFFALSRLKTSIIQAKTQERLDAHQFSFDLALRGRRIDQ